MEALTAVVDADNKEGTVLHALSNLIVEKEGRASKGSDAVPPVADDAKRK